MVSAATRKVSDNGYSDEVGGRPEDELWSLAHISGVKVTWSLWGGRHTADASVSVGVPIMASWMGGDARQLPCVGAYCSVPVAAGVHRSVVWLQSSTRHQSWAPQGLPYVARDDPGKRGSGLSESIGLLSLSRRCYCWRKCELSCLTM